MSLNQSMKPHSWKRNNQNPGYFLVTSKMHALYTTSKRLQPSIGQVNN
uniref:Uncharacterized protein n=1 Tax=Arundo donax TaxID=35708 RepID=A0A0A8ZFL3_ARUDO